MAEAPAAQNFPSPSPLSPPLCLQSGAVREAAAAAGQAVIASLNPHASRVVSDMLCECTAAAPRWQIKVAALDLLASLATRNPEVRAALCVVWWWC